MNHIGSIIEKYRNLIGLTRKELAENICSEKYIYLIEKGERSPSVEIARLFSDRLGIDLFEYYYYLDCNDPISVRNYIETFNKCRRTLNFNLMNKIMEKAKNMKDFQIEPWSFEIFINKLLYDILIKSKYSESVNKINDFINKVHPKYAKSIYIANLNILLSTCYQLIGKLDKAKDAITAANDIIQKKQRNLRYKQLLISVNISMMIAFYHKEDYDRVIEIALFLEKNQVKTDSYERAHYILFFLAFAYYNKNLLKNAIKYLKKGLYMVLIYKKEIDMNFISDFDAFKILVNNDEINKELINKFKERYDYFL